MLSGGVKINVTKRSEKRQTDRVVALKYHYCRIVQHGTTVFGVFAKSKESQDILLQVVLSGAKVTPKIFI